MISKIRELLKSNTSNITTNLIWGISLAIPFFIVWGDYAATGWAISFTLLAFIISLFNPIKSTSKWLALISAVILSIFLVIRINPILTFFNFWAILYLLAFLSKKPDYKLDLLNIILLPLAPLAYLVDKNDGFPLKLQFLKDLKIKHNAKKEHKIAWTEIIAGLGITLIVMILILPFLAASNPLFASHLADLASFFNILNWGRSINYLFLNSFLLPRILLFLVLIFSLPKIFGYLIKSTETGEKQTKIEQSENEKKINLTWLLPKIITSLVLGLYISSQMELYMASKSQLAQMGYAYGTLINEIFFQLSFVAIVVFGLLYFDRSKKLNHNTFSVILLVEAFFILGVALKTNLDYIQTWGLTFKRLYGLVVYAILVVSYLWHFYCRFAQKSLDWFWKGVSATILTCLIAINFVNFDSLIYTYNQSLGNKMDQCSYVDTLSSDAQIPQDTYDKIRKQTFESKNNSENIGCKNALKNIESQDMILFAKCQINGFSGMYAGWNNLFTFNYSKYVECKRLSDKINTMTFFNGGY